MSETTEHWHGTYNGYSNRNCRCEECRVANAEFNWQARRKRAETLAPDDERHGRASTYLNYMCRCDRCREARNEQNRRLRARKRANR